MVEILNAFLPPWPTNRPRSWVPVAQVLNLPTTEQVTHVRRMRDLDRLHHDEREQLGRLVAGKMPRRVVHHNGFGTFTCAEFAPALPGPFTAVASTNAEAGLLQGGNDQVTFSPPYFKQPFRRATSIWGRGIFSTTATPTLTFKFYLNSTIGLTQYSGTTIAASAAITSGSGVSNKSFAFRLDLVCTTPGQGATNSTLYCQGDVWSFGGFASPFSYALTPGTGDSATVTATLDGSVNQYFNASLTWSASSSSNTATLASLYCTGWN